MVPLTFSSSFVLPDLCNISADAFELKRSPHQSAVRDTMEPWLRKFGVYQPEIVTKFIDVGQFDLFAALSFPDADATHLETCLAFFFWAFSTDDRSDEGELQSNPDEVQKGIDECCEVLDNHEAPAPHFPYAAMLHDILGRLHKVGSEGMQRRFATAFQSWSSSQVEQSYNRSVDRLPTLEEFIPLRRRTIGAAMVEAMVEYSLDLDIPDYVFEDPVIAAMSDATSDIMTWPNDLCSFNKEQADGDYQNLVCILMVQFNLDLQEAVDLLVDMQTKRVADYCELKSRLPSFGPEVDTEVAKYIKGLEHFVQGTIVWYYLCPRYFRGLDAYGKESVEVQVFKNDSD